ncbi:hypothetical protein [Flammeovirga sp. OC4]|uniref:hypothetical protein n=1 Tax=Flammeovirga sp. OC4 TaxID=1382345 RepID=UPI0005C4E690|nr:hypothetical protein [Flammeovirga sp. OC4]
MENIADRIIELYKLDERGNIKKLAERMGVSHTSVQNYRFCETPPKNLLVQISKDFDGKEGRPLINWNWLFTGMEPMFKNMEDLPPEPPTPPKKEITLEALKDMIVKLDNKLSSEIRDIKNQAQKDSFVMSGLMHRVSSIETGNLGKHKDNFRTLDSNKRKNVA